MYLCSDRLNSPAEIALGINAGAEEGGALGQGHGRAGVVRHQLVNQAGSLELLQQRDEAWVARIAEIAHRLIHDHHVLRRGTDGPDGRL